MDEFESLSHSKWECKYHVVFISKFRRKVLYMLLSIPPKYAVSQVVGYIKGKSAIHLARVYGELKRGFIFFVSTVGRDEKVIRDYTKNQEKEDQRLDQLNLWR